MIILMCPWATWPELHPFELEVMCRENGIPRYVLLRMPILISQEKGEAKHITMTSGKAKAVIKRGFGPAALSKYHLKSTNWQMEKTV